MKRKILVRLEDYKNYTSKFNTNKLDSNNIIYTKGGFPNFLKINGEIFDDSGIETEYNIKSIGDNYLIKFSTNSETEYRFDLFKEPDIDIYHLSFSLYDSLLDDEYHNKTNKGESLEVYSRLIWILNDLNKEINVDEYCIGATGDDSKDRIYEYMMRFVDNWERRETDQYNLGWAIYFKI